MAVHKLFVLGSFCLVLAFITSGISFFAPYWLGNVNKSYMQKYRYIKIKKKQFKQCKNVKRLPKSLSIITFRQVPSTI